MKNSECASWARWIQSTVSHPALFRFLNIMLTTPTFSKWSLILFVRLKFCMHLSSLVCPAQHIIHSTVIIYWRIQLWSFLFRNFLHTPFISTVVSTDISSAFFLHDPSSCLERPSSLPVQRTVKLYLVIQYLDTWSCYFIWPISLGHFLSAHLWHGTWLTQLATCTLPRRLCLL
jgi:hypothetical protein